MDSFVQLKERTEKQLGRKLHEHEINFVQWLFKRYTEEEHYRVNAGS